MTFTKVTYLFISISYYIYTAIMPVTPVHTCLGKPPEKSGLPNSNDFLQKLHFQIHIPPLPLCQSHPLTRALVNRLKNLVWNIKMKPFSQQKYALQLKSISHCCHYASHTPLTHATVNHLKIWPAKLKWLPVFAKATHQFYEIKMKGRNWLGRDVFFPGLHWSVAIVRISGNPWISTSWLRYHSYQLKVFTAI